METSVGQNTAPIDVVDNQCSSSLIDTFDTIFYELAAFGDVHSIPISAKMDISLNLLLTVNQSGTQNNVSIFQLSKLKFPTFSGVMTEWQGFEDVFQSILSHAPELLEVERFEYLKISLQGEALSLISHISITAANYNSA